MTIQVFLEFSQKQQYDFPMNMAMVLSAELVMCVCWCFLLQPRGHLRQFSSFQRIFVAFCTVNQNNFNFSFGSCSNQERFPQHRFLAAVQLPDSREGGECP